MVDREALQEALQTHFEWLAVREDGKAAPVRLDEIEVTRIGSRIMFGYVGERGFRTWHAAGMQTDGTELTLELRSAITGEHETVRFVPRESAAALAATIEAARLKKANDLAELLKAAFPGMKPLRVALSKSNGRLAQLEFAEASGRRIGAIADITGTLGHESLLIAALERLEESQARRKKNPLEEVWVAAEKRRARELRKLLATLNAAARSAVRMAEISMADGTAKLLTQMTMSDLWRERPRKLRLPAEVGMSETARSIAAHAPDKIDIVFSRQGETLRFQGLPFARTRRLMGNEDAWFGIGRERRPLNDETREHFDSLLDDLHRSRDAEPASRRHDLYRSNAEAWLESILKRNIKALDPNLVLSPIYSQFRAISDKIDLLALRRDGRLVIIEIKATPDRGTVYQAADYWRKIELQRRRGVLSEARLFGNLEISDQPAMIYIVAPALSFHRDFERHAGSLSREIELWRWELHENWRNRIKVIRRQNYTVL